MTASPPSRLRAAAPSPRARCRGVTLLESVLFIAIAVSIMLSGLLYYENAAEVARVNLAVRQLTTMTSQVRAMYATVKDFSDLRPPVLIRGGAIQAGGVNQAGDGIVSPWGAIEVGPDASDPFSFYVTLFDLPRAACTRLGIYSAAGQGVVADNVTNFEVKIAGDDFVSADTSVRAGRPTDGVSPTEAAAACGGPEGSVMQVRWTFAR